MFPQVAEALTTVRTTNATAWDLNIPAHNAGDILLALIGCDGAPTATSVDAVNGVSWNVLTSIANGTANRLIVAWLRAVVDQPTPILVNMALSATEQGVTRVLRITGAHTTSAPEVGVAVTGSSTLPNPPALNPTGWDVEDTLWLAASNTDAAVTATVYPTNMDVATGFSDVSGGGNGAGLHTVRAERAVASLDPTTFTLSATETWVAQTIAIRPAPAVPPKSTGTDQISLANVPVPATRTGHKLGVRARKTNAAHIGTMRLQLFEGSTARSAVLETTPLSTTLTDYMLSIADVDAAAITDYSNLSIKFSGYASSGSATVFEVDQFWLETPPGVGAPQTLYGATSMAVTFGKAVAGQRKTFGQIARPFIFGKDVRGQRKVFGQISLPITFTASIAGDISIPGEFSPSDLTDLALWYDAETLGLANSSPVTSWPDLSGQGRTLTTTMAPIFQTNALNGKPGVQFDGFDDYLTHLAGTPFINGKEITVFAVYKRLSGTSNGRIIAFNDVVGGDLDDYSTPRWTIYEGGANDRIAPYSNGELAIQVPHPTEALLMTTWFDGTNHNLRVDKAPASTPAFSTAQMGDYTFATNRITLSCGWFGVPSSTGNHIFHEVVVYDRALTTTERDQVEAYLDEKWFGAPAGPQTYFGSTSLPVTFSKDVRGQRKTFGQIARPVTFGATTSGRRKTFSQIIFPITFTKEAVGLRKVFGQLSMQTLFGKETTGQRKTFGQIARPTTFGATIVGRRKTFSQISFPLTFSKEVQGRLKAFGQSSLSLVFGKEVQGQRKTFGQLLSPLIFGKNVAGTKKTFGQIAFPITAAISTAGVRMGLRLYGSLSLPMTFSKDVRGQRKAFGQVVMPLTFAKNVVGQRKTFGQIAFPIIFTKEAVGRKNVFGQLAMQTLFGKEIAGRRRTFSQLALPITFAKAVSGRRKTFGRVALPINTTIVVNGFATTPPKTYYGQLALPIIFSKQVAAYRKTFGQITAPLLFGSASQAQRKTFGQIIFPFNFTAAVQSGRVGAHGALKLDLILTTSTDGDIKIFGVILNQAEMVYLGSDPAVAVYVGNEQVWWPPPDPVKLPGLVGWWAADTLNLVDGSSVSSWPDLSDLGHNLVPVTVGAPLYKTNVINGLSVTRFDGVDDVLNALALTSYRHIFVVAKYRLPVFADYDGLVGSVSTLVLTAYADNTVWYPYEQSTTTYHFNGVEAVGNWPGPMAQFAVMSIARHTGSWAAGAFQVGQDRNIAGRTWDGDVAEVVVYDRVLSTEERQQVEAYLQDKWGI